jgi:hypothetical protein
VPTSELSAIQGTRSSVIEKKNNNNNSLRRGGGGGGGQKSEHQTLCVISHGVVYHLSTFWFLLKSTLEQSFYIGECSA